jgi:hypothetical protein
MNKDLFDGKTEPTVDDVKGKFLKEDGSIDTEALLTKAAHADAHIAKIEGENANLRKEVDSRINYEDLLDRLAETRSARSDDPDLGPSSRDEDPKISEDVIDRMIERKLTIKQQEALHASNMQFAARELQKSLGPDYVQKLRQKAAELDMTEQEVNALAMTKPKALLALVAPAVRQVTDNSYTPPNSTTRVSNNSSTGVKNNSYYSQKIRENPNIINNQDFVNEMHAEAMKQKESFFN